MWVVPVLLTAAVVPWSQGPSKARMRAGQPGTGRSVAAGPAAVGEGRGRAGTGRTSRLARRRWWQWTRTLRPRPEVDLGAILTEVAARLRAGASTGAAWYHALPATAALPATQGRRPSTTPHGEGAPADPVHLAHLARLVPPAPRLGRPRAEHTTVAHQVAGAQVACRVAHRLGAPLAQVLDACAAGVSEAGRAQGARRTALAAPRATARLLGWLPLAGLVLGSAWGAEPLQVLLGGGWGSWCLVLGVALMVAGHVWSARLVRSAEGAGS